MRQRKTDYGTIILHWLLVLASCVAFLTGLRIASEAPDRTWINAFDLVLPRTGVWTTHMQAAVVLVAVALGYTIYLARSGLSRRVMLDRIRLRGLVGRKQARLGAISVVLNWVFFLAMLALIITGGLLYFSVFAGHDTAMVHWIATWVMLGFAGLHILTHYRIGGASQLLRIFRPERLPAPPPRLDAVELLTLLVEQSARLAPEAEHASRMPSPEAKMPSQEPLHQEPLHQEPLHQEPLHQEPYHPEQRPPEKPRGDITDITRPPLQPHPHHSAAQQRFQMAARGRQSKPRNPTLQSNPFVVAAAIAITGTSALVAADWLSADRLQIHRIDTADAPTLDGDTSDRVWRGIQPFSVMTNEGGNFDGKGESRVDIKAVHDGTWAYFLFTWEDPTRSLKQLPLVKEIDGWHVLHNGYESGDEHDYNEDKFSVLLTSSDAVLAGDRTFHAGPRPIADAPATMSGRGLHYTAPNAGYVDVWLWKATSTSPTGWMDDMHFGPPLDPTPEQVRYVTPYRGGFAPDPGTPNYSENFIAAPNIQIDDNPQSNPLVTPRRLPKDLAATQAALGEISLDPNLGESDGARWFMTEAESIPYAEALDRLIPKGTVLPGVIITGEFTGDRADVRCAARWASGHWALEVARKLDTHSRYDVVLKTGTFMRVAAFDHSQIRHTRHIRPIRLEVE